MNEIGGQFDNKVSMQFDVFFPSGTSGRNLASAGLFSTSPAGGMSPVGWHAYRNAAGEDGWWLSSGNHFVAGGYDKPVSFRVTFDHPLQQVSGAYNFGNGWVNMPIYQTQMENVWGVYVSSRVDGFQADNILVTTTVPEPNTYALMLLGLLALAARHQNRSRSCENHWSST